MRNEKTKNMILCAMFVALISVGAFIKIPVPVVPFTLQVLFTMLAGLLLGGKRGALAVCIYIVLGLLAISSDLQWGLLLRESLPTAQTGPDISCFWALILPALQLYTYSEWCIII